jgi:hypothetical protein
MPIIHVSHVCAFCSIRIFSTNEVDLTGLIENAQLKNDAYAIVGIMGCQSSGKSRVVSCCSCLQRRHTHSSDGGSCFLGTLLNLLFGTKFREMDSKTGRSQTTLGVWMDAGTNANNLVVMDLEGTDSTERGEDRVVSPTLLTSLMLLVSDATFSDLCVAPSHVQTFERQSM